MPITQFKQDVAAANQRPKAVRVSPDLYRELVRQNAITRQLGTPWGLDVASLGIELPFYDGDVFVVCDPELEIDGIDYKLP
jgi:hypothetical protein